MYARDGKDDAKEIARTLPSSRPTMTLTKRFLITTIERRGSIRVFLITTADRRSIRVYFLERNR